MAKINVFSSSASNSIKVFDSSVSAEKPNDAILVCSGDEGPVNAIKVNVVNDYAIDAIPVWFAAGDTPVPPGPTWETVTIGNNVWMAENLKYDDGGAGIYHSACVVNGVDFGEQYFYERAAIQRISGDFPGWHIPTQYDVELLYNEVAGDCESLRTSAGWSDGLNGNDLKGFHAEPLSNGIGPTVGRRCVFLFTDNAYNLKTYTLSANNTMTSALSGNMNRYTLRLVKDNL